MDFYQSQVDYYMEQKFADIRKHCLSSGEYFEDTEFPPGDDALFLKEKSIPELKWRRPNMLCNEPHLIVGGTSSMDLTTGEFGSPAFVAACSVLANHEDFWKRVVPDAMTQEWNPMKPMTYTGVFKFRFWRFGRWTEVVVDDRLPVLDDQLFGIRSTEKNEFWSALLEKAYAKLVGCYEALHNMDSGEILQDLTGGIIEPINLRETVTDSQSKDDLFEDICDSRMSGRALLTCWILLFLTDKEAETKGELGLVSGNVYAVNAVREIKLGTGLLSFFNINVINITSNNTRDTWKVTSYKGAWYYNVVCEKKTAGGCLEKNPVNCHTKTNTYVILSVTCNKTYEPVLCDSLNSVWLIHIVTHKQILLLSCHKIIQDIYKKFGRCKNNLQDTFMQNPQFRFDVTDTKVGNPPTIMIQLQQSESQIHRRVKQNPNGSIGFHIARVEINRQYKMHQPIFKWTAHPFTKDRSAFAKLNLPEGRYVIIPSMEEQGINRDFLLRVFCETNLTFCELNGEYPPKTCMSGLTGYPSSAISVNVVNGVRLFNEENELGNVYVKMTCEGVTVRSKTFRENSEPYFDAGAIFYRKENRYPVVFAVYHENRVCDEFIGQGTVSGNVEFQKQPVEVPLFAKNSWKAPKRFPGTLYVNVQTADSIKGL
uniref:Uncharacterized protein n=2 Tax=Ciona intestinalis TaxID=7719 RepID=F6ZVH3_CIOIN